MAEESVSKKKDMKDAVIRAIATVSGHKVEEISVWMSLGDFVDSLELVEVLLVLEDEHGVFIDENDVFESMDVRVLVNLAEEKTNA